MVLFFLKSICIVWRLLLNKKYISNLLKGMNKKLLPEQFKVCCVLSSGIYEYYYGKNEFVSSIFYERFACQSCLICGKDTDYRFGRHLGSFPFKMSYDIGIAEIKGYFGVEKGAKWSERLCRVGFGRRRALPDGFWEKIRKNYLLRLASDYNWGLEATIRHFWGLYDCFLTKMWQKILF